MSTAKPWQDWCDLVLGIWLFITPFFFAAANANYGWNSWILGVAIAIVAIWAMAAHSQVAEWINVILGAWVFIAPWALKFSASSQTAWNAWIVGGLVVLLSLSTLSTRNQSNYHSPQH